MKCWGANYNGQLGDGTYTDRLTPVAVVGLPGDVVGVAAGGFHTCAVTSGGGVWCWGDNSSGQLGDGTSTHRKTPVAVTGLGSGVVALSTGLNHTCAATSGGSAYCWGWNGYGGLGDGTTTTRYTPVAVNGLTSGVSDITVGEYHSCAVTAGGGVQCWGHNAYGQLGDGTWNDSHAPQAVSGLTGGAVAVAAGESHTCALIGGAGIMCWGNNQSGQLGDGTTTDQTTPVSVSGLPGAVVAVAAGEYHTCAITSGGSALCWGHNSYGQLGDGTETSRTAPVAVSGLASLVTTMGPGQIHTCAVTSGGAVKCWGWGYYGALGDGTNTYKRLVPVHTRGFGQLDFDADGLADAGVYRPSTGTWFSLDSSVHNTTYRQRGWGVDAQGDAPVVGDFDGDGIVDPTVFRPASGTWFILGSYANFTTWSWFGWGGATDTLVPGDYDGDGKTDAAVYRASTGTWLVRPSSGATQWSVVFGQAGDVPVAGDFDGDGKRDPAVYRASSGTWFWLKSSTNLTTYDFRGWGVEVQGDLPVPGDYDGDGTTDPCVFRPASGTWFILESYAGWTTWNWFGWGTSTDTLVPSDFDGDGKTDAAIYRATTGEWFVRPSSGGSPWSVVFGQAGDVPLITIR